MQKLRHAKLINEKPKKCITNAKAKKCMKNAKPKSCNDTECIGNEAANNHEAKKCKRKLCRIF